MEWVLVALVLLVVVGLLVLVKVLESVQVLLQQSELEKEWDLVIKKNYPLGKDWA
jgi:hypothetical protein